MPPRRPSARPSRPGEAGRARASALIGRPRQATARGAALVVGVLAVAAAGGASAGWGPYQVTAGDSLWSLAARTNTTVEQIRTMNGLAGSDLAAGDVVCLPGSRSGTAGRVDPPGGHVVQPGDSLSLLAARAGTTVAALAARNGMSPHDVLPVGQLLLVSPGPEPVPTDGDPRSEPLAATTGTDPAAAGSAQTGLSPARASAAGGPADLPAAGSSSARVLRIQSMIRAAAARQGVDPALALAVASVESDFDPAAVSRTGAVGIMQLMPRTAAWLSRRLGRPVDRADPGDNIAGGVAFLRYLLAATAGDVTFAAASYYQGLDSVRRDGFFPDTQEYVSKVTGRRAQFAQENLIVN
jgi:LysM repeat protein